MTSNKISRNIGLIRKISFMLLWKDTSKLILHPRFIHTWCRAYGNLLWASNYETRTKKRMIRILVGDNFNYSLRFKQLGILKFENLNRYVIGTILFSCKALNKLLPNWVKSILLVGWRNILIRPMGLHEHRGHYY